MPEHLRLTTLYLYYTGSRMGEVRKITWGMVSKDCTEIIIPARITKTDDGRTVVATENSVRSETTGVPIIREIMVATTMSSLFVAFFALIASTFRTRTALQAEILALRHQLAVFQKNAPRRLRLHRCDRLLWVV